MAAVLKANGLESARYIEPYAGGAGIAWELLITGAVRRVLINDISPHLYAFWMSAIHYTDEFCRRVGRLALTIDEWDVQKDIFHRPDEVSIVDLGVSCFYLNRTNRSGILNGGVIGGRDQDGEWLMDARFNRKSLVQRIRSIAAYRSRIDITRLDAVEFLTDRASSFAAQDFLYLDPPYFEKGRSLYYDAYGPEDHAVVAKLLSGLEGAKWIVSYDDVKSIRDMYSFAAQRRYEVPYSARSHTRGQEVMFFSQGLKLPATAAVPATVRRRENTS